MCPPIIALSFQTSLLFNGPTTFPILHSFQMASFFPEEPNYFTQKSFSCFLHLSLWQHLAPVCQYNTSTLPTSWYMFTTSLTATSTCTQFVTLYVERWGVKWKFPLSNGSCSETQAKNHLLLNLELLQTHFTIFFFLWKRRGDISQIFSVQWKWIGTDAVELKKKKLKWWLI